MQLQRIQINIFVIKVFSIYRLLSAHSHYNSKHLNSVFTIDFQKMQKQLGILFFTFLGISVTLVVVDLIASYVEEYAKGYDVKSC